jgi:signal transduction histidine kinase
MEKPMKQPIGLTALFWRYLLSVGALMLTSALLWWFCFALCINMGLVLPASYAASQVGATVEAINKEFDPDTIPHYFRWAVFDKDGNLADHSSGMSRRHIRCVRDAITGDVSSGFPYAQKHCMISLPGKSVCILQYDFSNPYADPVLEKHLPDFQGSMILLLLGIWGLSAGLCTRRYTRLLRQDAQTITAATQAIAARKLGKPFTGSARVRELEKALDAMDLLRESLADSLERQWAMEQQRQRELAALTHDLKTPLSIISGNGELLAEETLSPAQQVSVDAILRGAERLEDYISRLRDFTAGGSEAENAVSVSLLALFSVWKTAGEGLCSPKGVRFLAETPPDLPLFLQREAVNRAVLNLLDNAARYAGEDGEVTLSVTVEKSDLTISVADTGPGFTLEALARAGRELYTSEASRPQDGHIGWGLCYARQVAQTHNGTLRLYNTDHGAAAVLLLPNTVQDSEH